MEPCDSYSKEDLLKAPLKDLSSSVYNLMINDFSNFEKNNPSINAFKHFEERTRMSENALRSWLKRKSFPYVKSIISFYEDFLQIDAPAEVVALAKRKGVPYGSQEICIIKELQSNPNLGLIYRMIKEGMTVDENVALLLAGQNGLDCLEKLKKYELIRKIGTHYKCTKTTIKNSSKTFTVHSMNHVNKFPFQEHLKSGLSKSSRLENGVYKINKSDFDECFRVAQDSFWNIVEAYEEKCNSVEEVVLLESTLLATIQSDLTSKNESLQ